MARQKRDEAFDGPGRDGAGRGRAPAADRDTWVVLAGAVGVTLLTIAVAVGVVVASRSRPKPPPTAAAAETPTRQQFKEKVMGKTSAAVLASLGRPVRTRGDAKDEGTWSYEDVAMDPISGRVDSTTYVDFRKGVVVEVRP
jgi:hypothetical protein